MGYHELLLGLTLVGVLGTILVTAMGLIASYLTTKTLAKTALHLANLKSQETNKQKES